MRVKNDLHSFTSVCERLLASVAANRPLTKDEAQLLKHYCHELLNKLVAPHIDPEVKVAGDAAAWLTRKGSVKIMTEAGARIRVLIVDDHPLFREGIRSLLGPRHDVEVVGEAGDGETAVQLVRGLRPDVVLMDITLPRMSGIQATLQIKAEFPQVAIVGLSIHDSQEMAEAMASAGSSVYLTKDAAIHDLLHAIEVAVDTAHH